MLPQRVHLIGIGGAGMLGLARYLLEAGRAVSGSDRHRSAGTESLAAAGATVAYGHRAEQVEGAGLVVVSDAIPADNPELEAARRLGVPVQRRAEALDRLAEGRRALLVAGSHGKSTTTAMIVCILEAAGRDPAFVLGADVPCLGGVRSRAAAGSIFVAEACEAFRNLEVFTPGIAVISNIDDEHVNHYASQAALDAAFADFGARADIAIVSGEDAGVARILARLGAVTTFGLHPGCDVAAEPEPAPFIVRIGPEVVGEVTLRLPGDHVRRNALAAIAASRAAGVPFAAIVRGLERFTGVARRWQEMGTARGVRIIDDYAHHPAEIAATLRTARRAAPGARLVAAFQPLLHSRLQRLAESFAESLALADHVLLLEVDAGGEAGGSAGSAMIATGLRQRGIPVALRQDVAELIERAPADLVPGDLLLLMGGTRLEGAAEQLRRRLSELVPPSPTPSRHRRTWPTRLADALRRPATFVDLFRAAARAGPDQPAMLDPAGSLSYAALDAASDAVAAGLVDQALVNQGLADKGLGGRAIGVALPLSTDLVVAMLGIMKAGGAYLPLDLGLPAARMAFMLNRAGAAAVVARDGAWPEVPTLSLSALRASIGPVPRGPAAADSAYICFTSGSTGVPKGIRTGHAALFALLQDIVPRFGIGRDSRMLLNTAIGFDVSLAELCGTLAGGGALAVGGLRTQVGEPLAASLAAQGITHLSVTPTVLASVRPRPLPALRCIIACGEACPPELVRDWAGGRAFFNVYGPTETAIYATAARCVVDAPVTIGRPLGHLRAHVLDAALAPVAADRIGELCLGGPGVAAGYIDQPEETARRFVQTRLGRLYRTGDMARRGPDGALHFLGRVDEQVKIRGNRIELEEIERCALRQPEIAEAAVCVSERDPPTLVCFVRPAPGHRLDAPALLERLAAWLPGSAVPSHIVPVAAVPLTPSGKKDRRRLLTEHRARIVTRVAEYAPPRTPTEERLAALWQQVLRLDGPVGMFDRFAALAGDSLAGLMLVAEVEAAFGLAVPPGYFGRLATVPRMAVQLDELLWHRTAGSAATEGFAGSRIYRQLRDLSSHWPGRRLTADSLIGTLGPADATVDLFLCCQWENEFLALSGHLPPDYRVHAMRSGHLVIDQGPGSIRQLGTHYLEEIERIGPRGAVVLAGVCQGGPIVQLVAEMLAERGRPIGLLALIEPGRPRAYPGPAALFWAEDSFLNPLRPEGAGTAAFDAAMPGGFSVDLVPGSHGGACVDPAARFLASHLARRVSAVTLQPELAR